MIHATVSVALQRKTAPNLEAQIRLAEIHLSNRFNMESPSAAQDAAQDASAAAAPAPMDTSDTPFTTTPAEDPRAPADAGNAGASAAATDDLPPPQAHVLPVPVGLSAGSVSTPGQQSLMAAASVQPPATLAAPDFAPRTSSTAPRPPASAAAETRTPPRAPRRSPSHSRARGNERRGAQSARGVCAFAPDSEYTDRRLLAVRNRLGRSRSFSATGHCSSGRNLDRGVAFELPVLPAVETIESEPACSAEGRRAVRRDPSTGRGDGPSQ